jgi:poly(3-hydroxybutyrate) depolymerase
MMPSRRRFLAALGLFGAALPAGRVSARSFSCEAPAGADARRVEQALAAARREPLQALPPLALPAREMTVSGLSSGAAMAMQLHLAHSARIRGVALLAGPAWGCALDDGWANLLWLNAWRAQTRCMEGRPEPVPVERILARLRRTEASGGIDPLAGVAAGRAWLLTSASDATVLAPVMRAVAEIYRALIPGAGRVLLREDLAVGHGWPTEAADSDPADGLDECARTAPPYLNACRTPATRQMLEFLLERSAAAAPPGRLLKFDQRPYRLGAAALSGLAEHGWLCLPARIDAATRIHIALHGCCQSIDRLGNLLVIETGLAAAASAFNLAILLPQAAATAFNPKGCWDWWGYTEPFNFGADSSWDYPTRCGPQLRAIMAMVEALSGERGVAANRC